MQLTEDQIRRIARQEGKKIVNGGSGMVIGGGSASGSSENAREAQHAKEADHAASADKATEADHAAKAAGLDDGAQTGLDNKYLRKDQPDETKFKLTMGEAEVKGALTVGGEATVGGKVVTDDIHSSDSDGNTSMTGKGWTLRNVSDETGSYSVLAVDNIVVRKKMEAAELEIHRKTYVGAQQIASDWGHKILRVDLVSMDYETGEVSSLSGLTLFTLPVTVDGVERPVAFVGRALSDTETRVELLGDGKGVLNRELETTANAFKVYFCESDGTASIEDDLVVGAMGQCQEFNVKARVTHNFQNTYYWGVCVKHGVEDNVMIGGKATKCVYGVFAHTTKLITLTSEVSKKTFTCYGMEQAGCTFPVAGDDMVGFGCADPWQDADRCNAIITASKDGEKSAPSVIAYSGIGRKRGGSVVGELGADDTCDAYAGIEEQYSVPSAKDDSRLDFRVSKKAGNVFKGDLYFKGSDGALQPIDVTYMLSADKSVVEYGGYLIVTVYKIVSGKAVKMSDNDITAKGFTLSLIRDDDTSSNVTSLYSKISWSYLIGNHDYVKNVVIRLTKGSDILDTISVALGEEAVAQTEVWRLMAVKELAEVNYDINKENYSNYAESGETDDDTIDNIFVKKGSISLEYRILFQRGDEAPKVFTTLADAQKATGKTLKLTVMEFGANDQILGQYTDQDGTVAATHLQSLYFTDSSSVASAASYVKVNLLCPDGNQLDLREVRMKLDTNGVADFNKKFLAYIYYGTDSDKPGIRYVNKHVSDMKQTVDSFEKWKEDANGKIEVNTANIKKTADGLSAEIESREATDINLGKLEDNVSKISQRADEISTQVKSLYTEGNLLTGGDVKGSRAKRYQAYGSPVTTHLRKGITYTVTARMWLEAKDGYPTQPKMDGHYMTMYVFTEDWNSQWAHSYTYTKSGTVVGSFSFTPESDIDVLVGIYEQISGGPDPKEYGGVSVDWVRLDMGDMTGENQIAKWTPSAGDVETLNLIPDPNFEVASWETTDGASSRGTIGDVSFMSLYTDDYEDYGFRGVRMTRSGYTGKYGNSDGLIYYIPFRGEGDYAAQAFIKDLNGVTLDDAAFIEVHPADVNQRRICYGFSFALFRQTDETGYFRVSRTYHFGKTATNAATGEAQEIQWLEVRVFLTRNGDVVVSRLSLAKCGHAVHWNANALGSENGKTLSMESYAYQRADSIGAGIRQGLQSVGFRMDSATWSMKTWGNRFAWYANEEDANAGTNAKMWLDTNTDTLHVKGDIETTGGSISFFDYDASGLRTPSYGDDNKKFNGVGISINNISVSGNTNNRISSVYLGNGTIDSRWSNINDITTYRAGSTSLGSTFYNYIKLEKINDQHNSFENNPEHAALGVETQGDVCITALGGASYFQALAFATESVSSGTTADGKRTLYFCSAGVIFTLPKDPTEGLLIIVIQTTAGKIYFDGNGKRFRIGSDISDPDVKAFSNVSGQWSFFIYSGSYWYCNFIEPGNGMW